MESSRRNLLQSLAGASIAFPSRGAQDLQANASEPTNSERQYWLDTLDRIARPVLRALSEGKLKASMPVEAPHGNAAERRNFTHLEAFGRLMAGIAPWLESGDDAGAFGDRRRQYQDLARACIRAATDPASPDFLNFSSGAQPVVGAAFLALAILRAPKELWAKLDPSTQKSLVNALRSSRAIRPSYSNWLLFSATVEAFLAFAGEDWDPMRVDYAIRKHEDWYKGDGVYGDGPALHWDYYNSFVIQPMLLAVTDALGTRFKEWDAFRPEILKRARRYAAIQERLIAPDGSFPGVGRSITYRFGAFHLLADIARRRELPPEAPPQQVRPALTAVIRRMIEAPGTFDQNGWLQVGFCGHQPELGGAYISTGSLYLCSVAFLPLGLSRHDTFWTVPATKWTSQKMWSGDPLHADHAI